MADATDRLSTSAAAVMRVRSVVIAAGEDLRRRHPLLRQQNAIGAGILAFALLGMIGSGWLYLRGSLPWWICVPLIAWFASLTHELEHDLIHLMYFRKNPLAHNLMMALVWLARPSTVNPWLRRELHLNHHKHSGTARDIEERAITLGEPWGLRRLLMQGDNMMSVLLRLGERPGWAARWKVLSRSLIAYFPLGWLNWGVWHLFLAFHAVDLGARAAGHPLSWPAPLPGFMHAIDLLTVLIVAPNVLRTFCLHTISSNMHYYGDIEDGNIVQQTQVLNPWWLWPLQLFCFNFGSTHAIHHFVVKEPFYVRQLTARQAHAVMREAGVRFNDLGTFRRANRWQEAAPTVAAGEAVAA